MTQEQKAKAYDEALEKARKRVMLEPQDHTDAILKDIFPQLKESEDERIRKEIVSALKFANVGGIYDKHLAYLEKQKDLDKMIVVSPEVWDKAISDAFENGKKEGEKQKEQKPTWSEEDEKILDSLIRLYGGEYSAKAWPWSDGVITYGDVVNFLKSLRPQPKQEWNEDWREEDIQTRFAFYTYKNEEDDGVLYLSNVFVEEASRNHGFGTRILRAAEKVAEIIGATTICLKVKQDSPANAWYRKNGYGYVAFEDGYDWLEKNLEYMKPNKQDWSEEDERKYQCIRSILLTDMDKKIGSWKYSEILEWYEKRGTGRYTNSQPHWKPSEDEERLINTSISFLKDFADKGYENAVECIDWLKSKLNGNSC